jgi:hypothetical protein
MRWHELAKEASLSDPGARETFGWLWQVEAGKRISVSSEVVVVESRTGQGGMQRPRTVAGVGNERGRAEKWSTDQFVAVDERQRLGTSSWLSPSLSQLLSCIELNLAGRDAEGRKRIWGSYRKKDNGAI